MNDVKLEGLKFVRMRGTFLALTKDQLELLKILEKEHLLQWAVEEISIKEFKKEEE